MRYQIEPCTSPEDGAMGRLRLEGEITLESTEHLKRALIEALDAHRRVMVDCSEATAVDLAALQLMCAAHRTAAATGRMLSLAEIPEEIFEKAIGEAGFQRHRSCLMSPDAKSCLWITPPA